jgi:hypothetical protein
MVAVSYLLIPRNQHFNLASWLLKSWVAIYGCIDNTMMEMFS